MDKSLFANIVSELDLYITDFELDSKLSDLGIDSIHIMMLIVVIEDLFGIIVDDDDLIEENFETVQTVLSLITKYTGEANNE